MTKIYSYEGLAAELGCSARQLQRRIKDGSGPTPTRMGRLVRFTDQAVHEWLARSAA